MPEKRRYWQKVTIHTPLNGAAGADPYSACALFLMQPGTRRKVTSRKKKSSTYQRRRQAACKHILIDKRLLWRLVFLTTVSAIQCFWNSSLLYLYEVFFHG